MSESIHGQTVEFIKDNTKMIKSMDMASTAGPMVEFIVGSGLKESSMASEYIQLKGETRSTDYGRMVNALSGLSQHK